MVSYRNILLAAGLSIVLAGPALAQEDFITVASTTSTEQSGLFDHILPIFEEATGSRCRVIAQGTGQALDTGRRGDVDVVFVHAKAAEEEFVAEGYGRAHRGHTTTMSSSARSPTRLESAAPATLSQPSPTSPRAKAPLPPVVTIPAPTRLSWRSGRRQASSLPAAGIAKLAPDGPDPEHGGSDARLCFG